MEDPFLQTVLDHVIGRDVVRKLMQVRRRWNSHLFIVNMITSISYFLYVTIRKVIIKGRHKLNANVYLTISKKEWEI